MSEKPSAGAPSGTPSPFRIPIFRDVWIANLASRFGGLVQSVGASWMMLQLAASPTMVGLVQASTTLPIMLFALAAGAAADTYDRRKLMIAAQIFMLVVSVALAGLALLGMITPWLLLAFTFLIGCGAALNGPAWQASVGEMVPRPALPAAVALNSMGFNVARSVGPAIGGAIVTAAGAAAAFAVNAVSYVGLIVVLARWRAPVADSTLPRERLGTAMKAGVRYVALSPGISAVLGRSVVFGVGASAIPALTPLVARDLVGGGPVAYGALLGAFGVGAVGGAFLSTALRARFSSEWIVRGALVGLALSGSLVAISGSLVATMAVLLFGGAGWVLALSTFNVTVQMQAPRWVVARALAMYQMAAFGGMAGGSWLWGSLTESAGLPAALWTSAAVLVLCAAVGLRFPLPPTAALNLDPLGRWREPELRLDIEPRSGPVVVTIAYRIADADVPRFLAVMGERRRVRRRDGARDWSLLRDLGDPEVWIERYQSPTWLEYVRQNSRLTKADAAIGAALRTLHQGPGKPSVHRLIERQTGAPDTDIRIHEMAQPLTDPARQS